MGSWLRMKTALDDSDDNRFKKCGHPPLALKVRRRGLDPDHARHFRPYQKHQIQRRGTATCRRLHQKLMGYPLDLVVERHGFDLSLR